MWKHLHSVAPESLCWIYGSITQNVGFPVFLYGDCSIHCHTWCFPLRHSNRKSFSHCVSLLRWHDGVFPLCQPTKQLVNKNIALTPVCVQAKLGCYLIPDLVFPFTLMTLNMWYTEDNGSKTKQTLPSSETPTPTPTPNMFPPVEAAQCRTEKLNKERKNLVSTIDRLSLRSFSSPCVSLLARPSLRNPARPDSAAATSPDPHTHSHRRSDRLYMLCLVKLQDPGILYPPTNPVT